MSYWLVKSEPSCFSWQQLLDDQIACWDGVRNYQARKNLMMMKLGDKLLFYHSITGKEVMGIAEVTREYYPDPTDNEGKWVTVDVIPIISFKNPVSLQQIKNEPELSNIGLIRQGRLSVMPLTELEFMKIVELGNN